MNKQKPYYLLSIILFIGIFISLFLYFFVFKESIIELYRDNPSSWLAKVIEILYPRFEVEKNRFSLYFFIDKAWQLIFRFCLISIILIFFLLMYSQKTYSLRVQKFWDTTISTDTVFVLRKLFCIISLYLVWDWIFNLYHLSKIVIFYQPVFLLKIFYLDFPPFYLLAILYIFLLVSIGTLFLGILPIFSSSVFAFLFTLLQAYQFSFYKLDHTYATFMYAAWLMPFLLISYQKAQKLFSNQQEGWALRLIQVMIALAYFLAGIEKILIGGWEWFKADTLITYLQLHQATLGLWLTNYPWVCLLLNILVVVFEVGFIGIIFFKKYTYWFLLSGICFHLGTILFLNVGGFITPWTLVYIFYIDWDKIVYCPNVK